MPLLLTLKYVDLEEQHLTLNDLNPTILQQMKVVDNRLYWVGSAQYINIKTPGFFDGGGPGKRYHQNKFFGHFGGLSKDVNTNYERMSEIKFGSFRAERLSGDGLLIRAINTTYEVLESDQIVDQEFYDDNQLYITQKMDYIDKTINNDWKRWDATNKLILGF